MKIMTAIITTTKPPVTLPAIIAILLLLLLSAEDIPVLFKDELNILLLPEEAVDTQKAAPVEVDVVPRGHEMQFPAPIFDLY